MKHLFYQRLLGTAIVLSTIATGSNLVAAELEEIIVTAQKRAQNANDISVAIVAFTGETLDDLGVTETADLALITPGMTYADTGIAVPVFTLRGVGFNEDAIQATATVGIYNDQIATPFPIMTRGPLMDLQRVEILKGPQGTLYGRNSTGGAINYISNKPTDEFESSITLGFGSFETVDASGFISGALNDSIRARATFKSTQSGEGWQESLTRDDKLGEVDRTAARLILDADLSDDVAISFVASWWEDQSDTQAPQFLKPNYQLDPSNSNLGVLGLPQQGLLDGNADPSLNRGAGLPIRNENVDADWTEGLTPQQDMDATNLYLTLNWQINDNLSFTSLTGVSGFSNNGSLYNTDGFRGIDSDTVIPFPMAALGAPNIVVAGDLIPTQAILNGYVAPAIIGPSTFGNTSDIDAFTQELRLDGGQDDFQWILGAYFSDNTVESSTTQLIGMSTNTNIAATAAGLPLNYVIGTQQVDNISKQDATAWSVFGHSEWNFTDDWKLTAGLRYTEDNKDYSGCSKDVWGDTAELVNLFSQLLGGFNPNIPAFACATVLADTIDLNAGTAQSGVVNETLDQTSTSGRIALDYNVNDDVLTYISFSRGFKSGSFPTFSGNLSTQFEPVVQEQLDALEIGFKASLAGGAAQLNGAVFSYDYTDKQMLSKIPTFFGALGKLANVPESKVEGVEFDLQSRPADGLFISFGATYINTEVEEFVAFNQFGELLDMAGSEFPLTPDLQASFLINYEWSVSDNVIMSIGSDISYSSDFNTDYSGIGADDSADPFDFNLGESHPVDPAFVMPSATLVGLRLGFRSADDTWSTLIWGRNVTDEFNPNNARKTTDAVLRYNGMPATYGVTFSYNWN
jgi:outer membrane receptor protein involved in Fe transport